MDARLNYAAGFAVTIAGGWYPGAFPFSMEYTLVGDGGTIDFSSAGSPPTLYRADGTSQPLPQQDGDGYRDEISYFQKCCEEGCEPKRCPPEESAAAVRLTRALSEARQRRGETIAWTDK